MNAWQGFKQDIWCTEINVQNFIQNNYKPYLGNESFLAPISEKTALVWQEAMLALAEETAHAGVRDIDTTTVSNITSHQPGYIKKEAELIVGLQTDAPLKRSVIVHTGVRMAEQACEAYGYKLDPKISNIYHNHRLTHNSAVFEAYTDEMRLARSVGIITGLPDAYGRGRIIGDYRRVALYGIDRLIEAKQQDVQKLSSLDMNEQTILERSELAHQITALKELAQMAASYGYDITKPATNAQEAVQWLYFAYLASIKEQNGAAMSLGRTSTFLDIYLERDLENGLITEAQAQELIDQLVIKLRLARHLRTPEYNELFAGDPLWVTEAIGGMGLDGRTLVTKNSYRILHTLYNLGPSPEPNLTILWSQELPSAFKNYCAQVSIDTSAIQFENDDLMREIYGDDYGIACCVSAMKIGQQMQFFGARANLAKALLLAINSGCDEKTGQQLVPGIDTLDNSPLDYAKVRANYSQVIAWLAKLYVNTMNVIHYMHDHHAYEASQMALHDTKVERLMAFGIAGLSVAVDSLSAIRYAQVKAIRNAQGIAIDFEVTGEFPKFGNNDMRVDSLATELTAEFNRELKKHYAYRQAKHTLSVLTITSNVMYGQKTGATPDGRKAGEAFAPGANPMHGRDQSGALAAMKSICAIDYKDCLDGISYTFSVLPNSLGKTKQQQIANLTGLLDAYAQLKGHHINVNVFDRAILEDAMKNPAKYPQLTIRVSGYAVHFIKLSARQQQEVISRTIYSQL
ncbi:formate C-acetyltransferase [Succinispira mobilis]|uniref:formate C-acetyltransferase n=1 Tax=Succinispira mobilis TaxID=78120 RepID=UPI0003750034|nr:formate C-acetyltransferase [Succinispira mobilis]